MLVSMCWKPVVLLDIYADVDAEVDLCMDIEAASDIDVDVGVCICGCRSKLVHEVSTWICRQLYVQVLIV